MLHHHSTIIKSALLAQWCPQDNDDIIVLECLSDGRHSFLSSIKQQFSTQEVGTSVSRNAHFGQHHELSMCLDGAPHLLDNLFGIVLYISHINTGHGGSKSHHAVIGSMFQFNLSHFGCCF